MTFAEILLLAIVIVGVWMLRGLIVAAIALAIAAVGAAVAFVVVCVIAACEAVADRKKP